MIFWRLFANYFVLILIPVIAAMILAHVLVIRIIEQDAERFNTGMMNRFSEQTDASLQSLKTNMINMLSTSNLRSLLLTSAAANEDNERRTELLHSLREQLQKLEAEPLVKKAYYYFVHEDLIVDAETYTNKSYYYTFRYPLNTNARTELSNTLTGKKMMAFTDEPASLTAMMSYPFNTSAPDVYLIIDVHSDKLKEQIYIPEEWVTGTAIINHTGAIISQTGLSEINQQLLLKRLQEGRTGSQFTISDKTGLSFSQSSFDESWYYVSMIDLGTLMKPVAVTRIVSWLFLLFFLLVGGVASYYLSRRWYRPIAEIKEGLETHRLSGLDQRDNRDEFTVIKQRSQLIISENKELFQMVNGMRPIIQEQFVAKILLGQYRDSLSIMYYAKEIGFNYSSGAARTVYCIVFHYEPSVYDLMSESSKTFLHAELKDSIHRLAPNLVWLCQLKPDMLACIIQHDSQQHNVSEYTAEQIKGLLMNHSMYFKATIGVGSTVHTVEELHLSYSHAASMLKHRGLHSTVEICKKEASQDRQQWDSFLSVKDVNVILNQHKAREYDKLLLFVLELLEEGKRRDSSAVQMKYLCADVLNTWIRAVESEHNELNVPYYSGLFEKMNRCMTWEELKHCFEEIHGFLFRTVETTSRSQQFQSIVAYIHEHYDQELSIEYFAGLTNMSIGHFSRTFKEEVGEKFVEYIAKCRLNRAKHLLVETDLKMDEIAEKVGYWGRNSLIRAFRRYEGITPAKYRTLHQ